LPSFKYQVEFGTTKVRLQTGTIFTRLIELDTLDIHLEGIIKYSVFLNRSARYNRGFTLIELIVVIVILAILAAIALPKFVDLSRDARIGVVNALAGAVKAADSMIYGAAVVNGYSKVLASSYPTGSANPGGTGSIRLWCGHPDVQWDGIGNVFSDSNVAWGTNYNSTTPQTYQAFTFQINAINQATWQYTTAPNPPTCVVTYSYFPGFAACTGTGTVSVTVNTSGC